MTRRFTDRGFSLIEIIVVLVILLVGVLSLLRIFPRAFLGLGATRDHTMAQVLARSQIDSLESRAQDLPHQMLAVRYRWNGPNLIIEADPGTSPNDLGPGGEILENGNIRISSLSTQIYWRFYNDANRIRRVIAEGGTIPAPKAVGRDYGSLRILNFGPMVNDVNLLLVYGADMEGRVVFDSAAGEWRRNPQRWQFLYDDEAAQVWLPGVVGRTVGYKINFSYWVNDVFGYRKVDIIDLRVAVVDGPVGLPNQAAYSSATNEVEPFDLRALAGNPPGWVELAADSVIANRLFDTIPVAQGFDPTYPYEYKVLNGDIGVLLFNPAGYNFRERRRNVRVPLVGQVNYDVFNWHIIREELRADRTRSPLHKLSLQSLLATGERMNDKRKYPGLALMVPTGDPSKPVDLARDFVIIDMDTGGVVAKRVDPADPSSHLCYKMDYLRGLIALASPLLPPPDPNNRDELAQSITIIAPGDPQDPSPVLITNVNPAGRNFRMLYQANNDWAVQVLKAPARFDIVYDPRYLSVAQCYVGGSNGALAQPGLLHRVYFPWAILGMKVSVREIWYRSLLSSRLKVMRDQDFLIRPPLATDPVGLPYIDIKEADRDAAAFDYSTYGYAVRGVAGSSVRARVIWNNAQKEDVRGNTQPQIDERMDLHREWTRNWRRVSVESYLSRRDKS